MNDPILITGAAGFIGFHTARKLLEDGVRIVGIDNMNDYYDDGLKEARLKELAPYDNFVFQKLDITDNQGLKKLSEEYGSFRKIIHLAAQAGVRHSLKDPYAYVNSNCMGHLSILELCRNTEGFEHLVYASSSSVYGGNDTLPFSVEDRVDHPVSLYAATKRSGELISDSYAHLYKIPQTGLRFFTVYGPWGRPDMAPIIFSKAIQNGEKLPVFNGGEMKRDFTYIDDIVAGVIAAVNNPPENSSPRPHRTLNLGNNRSEKLMDFIATLEQALGKKAELDFKEMQPGDVCETYANIDETTALLGYHPTTTIAEGVPRFIEWFKSYYSDRT